MPSDAEQLATIKSQALSLIATITAEPKPTYSVDGQSVDWADYLRRLQDTIAWCDTQLAAQEPFEIATQATT